MRADMKKVLTERPRRGGGLSYGDFRNRETRGDPDLLPCRQGMRVPYRRNHGNCKEFSDLLGPLRRFLHGCIGRRWDGVWSEVCANVDANSVSGSHLRGHVVSEVETKCFMVGDEVHERSRFMGPRPVTGLYVHPEDGTLRHAGDWVRPRWDRDTVRLDGEAYRTEGRLLVGGGIARLVLDHGVSEAVRVGGTWYWVTFADVPPPYEEARQDAIGAQSVRLVHHSRVDVVTRHRVASGRYRDGKRQMSFRDLRRLGLANDDG
jgi:hypothetical protein